MFLVGLWVRQNCEYLWFLEEVVAGKIGIGLEIEVDVVGVGGCEWVCELKVGIRPNSEG